MRLSDPMLYKLCCWDALRFLGDYQLKMDGHREAEAGISDVLPLFSVFIAEIYKQYAPRIIKDTIF